MKRFVAVAIIAVSAAAAVSAQSPKGWKVRADRSTNASDPDGAGAIKFTQEGSGFHAVNPQAAVYWNPANTATGAYTVKGSFTLNKPSGHTNYYGIIFGGSDLDNAKQSYTYFLVAQNGSWLIKKREGDANTSNVVASTMNEAVKKPGADGKSTNVLEVRVGADKIDYVVNGTVVHSMPKAGVKTDGIYGIRVNHLLDVQVDGFGKS
jgi:hypothetical protein